MSSPVIEFPSRQAAMRELIGLLDRVGASPRPDDLLRIRAVSLMLVGELGQLVEQADELLKAAGYETGMRVVPKSEVGGPG